MSKFLKTKSMLIASVAALAVAAPALAERGGHGPHGGGGGGGGGGGQPQQAQPQQAPQPQQQRPQQEQRQQMRMERQQAQPQRFERPQQMRVERQQPRIERQQMRVERQQPRIERQQMRVERQQPRIERQQMRVERQQPRIERQQRRVERQQPRIERQQMRVERQQPRIERQQMRVERQAVREQQQAARTAQRVDDRQQRFDMRQAERARAVPADSFMPGRTFVPNDDGRFARQAERQQQRDQRAASQLRAFAPQRVTIGERLAPQSFASTALPLGARSIYGDTSQSYYRYDDGSGYLYQINRNDNLVTSMVPLLGGAFSVGQPLPVAYRTYDVPVPYQSLYYNSPNGYYSYGSGAIYQVDPQTQVIQSVVQLLTGNNLGVGQILPASYGVYNVPVDYRDRYYDTADNWYRYNDGYIYQVDPYSRTIEDVYPAYYGAGYNDGYYGAGTAFPLQYADYNVPYGYQSLYYDTPQYDYRYANGGIYQLDPTTQVVQALVALVSGRNFGVGSVLPASYGLYNVPDAYRDQYYDTADSWYRYNDGNIYQVQPRTRVIERIVPVSYGAPSAPLATAGWGNFGYDGYPVGTMLPPTYADYNVPLAYRDVYYDTPQFDYRYANGAIYQVDPQTRMVQSLAALVGGEPLAIGQTLPAGYGVYNVPEAYRDRYADTADSWYRYNDGYIYQVDPRTQVINGMFDVV